MRKNKKIMKRLFGILISIVMMMGMMATTAFADDGSATITINKPADIESINGMTVKAYMVLDQDNPTETDSAKKQYTAAEKFNDFFNIAEVKTAFNGTQAVYLGYNTNEAHLVVSNTSVEGYIQIDNKAALDNKYPEADLVGRIEATTAEAIANNGDIATFYTWIEKYIEAKLTADNAATATVTANTDGSIQLSGLDEGYYALTFSNVPDGVSVKQGIIVATPATVNLKAEKLTLTKKVKPVDNKTAYAESATAELGEALSYEITSKVPTLTDYGNLTQFEFTDTMIRQTANPDSFNLKIDGATVTKDPNGTTFKIGESVVAELTLEPYGDVQDPAAPDDPSKKVPGQTFTLTFDTGVLKDYQGKDVTLTYQAALTADAVSVDKNIVGLTYTNGPDTEELTAETAVYTYGIEVTKNFSDGLNSENYKGVTFKLYTANEDGDKGTQILLTGQNGVYKVSPSDGSDAPLAIAKNGTLTITGLDAGSYWLEEFSAPDGYTKADDVKITLVKSDGNPAVLDADKSVASYKGNNTDILTAVTTQANTSISLGQFAIFNQKGFSLPQTGGAGTWMLTIGGIILIAAAAGLFVVSRRKASK